MMTESKFVSVSLMQFLFPMTLVKLFYVKSNTSILLTLGDNFDYFTNLFLNLCILALLSLVLKFANGSIHIYNFQNTITMLKIRSKRFMKSLEFTYTDPEVTEYIFLGVFFTKKNLVTSSPSSVSLCREGRI